VAHQEDYHYFKSPAILRSPPGRSIPASSQVRGSQDAQSTSTTIAFLGIDMREYVHKLMPTGSRLPAVEELFLLRYFWEHSESEFENLWDFSKLRSLILHDRVLDFFHNAPPSQLQQLESLELGSTYSSDNNSGEDDDFGSTTIQTPLGTFLSSLTNLKQLKIEVINWQKKVQIESIFEIGSRLQSLTLRNKANMNWSLAEARFSFRCKSASKSVSKSGISLCQS
jgi:hypothetical protein